MLGGEEKYAHINILSAQGLLRRLNAYMTMSEDPRKERATTSTRPLRRSHDLTKTSLFLVNITSVLLLS